MLAAASQARKNLRDPIAKTDTLDLHRRPMGQTMVEMGRSGFASNEKQRHLPPQSPGSDPQQTAALGEGA